MQSFAEPDALLTVAEMAAADRAAVQAGLSLERLILAAGRAVADRVQQMLKRGEPVALLCGPGNNGNDGLAAARCLRERGQDVTVFSTGDD